MKKSVFWACLSMLLAVSLLLPSQPAVLAQSATIYTTNFNTGYADWTSSGTSLPADFYNFTARMMHGFIVPALVLLVLLHVGAALYHQFTLKDNLLSRMWYGK